MVARKLARASESIKTPAHQGPHNCSRSKARMAGFLYLLIIIGALFLPLALAASGHDAPRFGAADAGASPCSRLSSG